MKAVAIRTASTAQSTLTTFSTTSITVSICDASKTHYGVIRWYEPVTGRWLSNDPIGISGGLNQYVFCGNNPVNMVDPWGDAPAPEWMNDADVDPVKRFSTREIQQAIDAIKAGLKFRQTQYQLHIGGDRKCQRAVKTSHGWADENQPL